MRAEQKGTASTFKLSWAKKHDFPRAAQHTEQKKIFQRIAKSNQYPAIDSFSRVPQANRETCSETPSVSPRSKGPLCVPAIQHDITEMLFHQMQTGRHDEIKEYQVDFSDVTVISARICKYKAEPAREIIASQLQRSQLRCQPSSHSISTLVCLPAFYNKIKTDAPAPHEEQQLARAACQKMTSLHTRAHTHARTRTHTHTHTHTREKRATQSFINKPCGSRCIRL